MTTDILRIEALSISFQQYQTFFELGAVSPIKKMDLTLKQGEITVIVGQSGSGKSLVAHAIMGILPTNAKVEGCVLYQGLPLDDARRKMLRRGEIVIIPQSVNYLDPLMPVGQQIKSLVHEGDPETTMQEALARYDLAPDVAALYPFQLSGGMARRVLISCAMVQKPSLIIADEPTPGLDTDLVEETINHLLEMKRQGKSLLVITHDLHVATRIADRIIFFSDGCTICEAERRQFTDNPNFSGLHPYAQKLFAALPENRFISLAAQNGKETRHTLVAHNVSFSYDGKKQVLENIQFSVSSGEIVGLTGKSGRGKTTLSRLLAGYLSPTAGDILLDNAPLYIGKRRYNPVQLIMQHPEKAVDPKWHMDEILAEPGVVEEPVKEALSLKPEWMKRFPQELSGGELQRFSIARVLNRHTRFLIADESSTMFDAATQAEIWKVIVEYIRQNNIGLILISHEPALLDRLCDRIVTY